MFKQRTFSKRRAVGFALLAPLTITPAMAPAATLENIRAGVEQSRTRLVFDMDESVYYTIFALSNPERIVIDFRDVDAGRVSAMPLVAKSGALVEGVRYATRGDGDLRVVLDLARQASTDTIQLDPDGNSGHRVVVDLFDAGSDPEISSGALADQPVQQPQTTSPIRDSDPSERQLAQADDAPAVLSSVVPAAGDGGGSFSFSNVKAKIDGTMATFDPIGKHVRQPIERAVPNLQFRGFIRQFSDFLVDRHGTVGFQQQDYRFLQLQNLAELETSYHVATGLDVKGIAHMMYDGAYDWQDSTGLFADKNDRTAEIYNTGERVLRELYVSYRRPAFDLKLGKQQVAWGKMDGQFIDIVNGMDRRESVQLEAEDYEFRRLPTWMANSTFHFGESTVQLLYIFDFEEDRQALPGSPWFSPNIPTTTNNVLLRTKRPSAENFSDHEYGIRVDRAAGALTYGFIYMYAWDKNPVDQVLGTQLVNGERVLTLQGEHERLHHVGATADYATTFQNVPWVGSLPTVFRVEALYTNGVRFADFEKQAQALAGSTTDGTSKRDTFRAAFATEFGLPGRTTAILQASWYQTINHKEELGPGFGGGFGNEWSFIPVVFLSRPFAFSRDRLSMEATLFPLLNGSDTGWGGIKSKLRLSYKVSQFVKANVLYTSYDTGDSNDLYGQYNKWDNFGWELSYEF
ncbi:MAG: AMIN domain-containing protein [Proteobacteria bacterium]|nr:AMIN domain-containing protein [Pseudomonadota bacterium]